MPTSRLYVDKCAGGIRLLHGCDCWTDESALAPGGLDTKIVASALTGKLAKATARSADTVPRIEAGFIPKANFVPEALPPE